MQKKIDVQWKKCLEIIRDNINEQSFNTWFEPIKPIKNENDTLTIQVPSQFFYEWIEENYIGLLKKTIKRVFGEQCKLEYQIVVDKGNRSKSELTMNVSNSSTSSKIPNELDSPGFMDHPLIKNPFIIPGLKRLKVESNLNQSYNFESFIEGNCNLLARNAGLKIAQQPGKTAFNPIVIYGGVGLGKTHLAQAIGNQIKQNNPKKIVLYVTSERFTTQYIDSIKTKSTHELINFYQLMDVLIIDDIQFFEGKIKTQESIFNIFNHLHQGNKQLILTSDRAPKDLENLEERLLSRFKWGLPVELTLPDFETRVAILENKMQRDGFELSKEIVEFIAFNIKSNVRELEGVLNKLMAEVSLNHKVVSIELAKKTVAGYVKSINKEISIELIIKLICEYFDVETEKLKEKTRKREIVQARQLSMFFSKEFTEHSLKSIGDFFGGRDHSTVIHSCRAVKDLIDTDETFCNSVDEIRRRIQLSV